ncbi:MAG: ABC transporter permease subunit, partial [Candidatus Latescibacteria bacterium]|nr:ABC transporter permease subunit [Candidatus Latescibacterota bacterium]
GGTLRLYASFPLRRSTIALAKIVGSTLAVLTPFLLAFLMMSALMALTPELGMGGDDWMRLAALLVVFGLYLSAFAGFGIWVSALTHRRITAFLALLALWMIWVFVLPNVGVGLARRIVPVESVYEIEKELDAVREEIKSSRRAKMEEFRFQPPSELAQAWQDMKKRGKDVPASERKALEKRIGRAWREAFNKVRSKVDKAGDGVYFARARRIQEDWRNRGRRQRQMAMALSALSPMSAATFASMDLARTGIVQHERIEDALGVHHTYLARFVQEKWPIEGTLTSAGDLTDFVAFQFHDIETVSDGLSRNLIHILNLVLLSILGFAGAYVSILRYDVR